MLQVVNEGCTLYSYVTDITVGGMFDQNCQCIEMSFILLLQTMKWQYTIKVYTIEGVDKIPIPLKQAYFHHLWK